MTVAPAMSRAAGRVVRGPYLTDLTDSRVDVRFELDSPGAATVEVARESAASGTAPAPAQARVFGDQKTNAFHEVLATGLEPATRYVYAVRDGTGKLASGRFTTAPRPDAGAPVKFLVYGDDRTDPTAHRAIVRAMTSAQADFLVNTGDLVEDGGSADDWQSFFEAEAPLLAEHAVFVSIGNHELYDDAAGANFARYFGHADPGGAARPYGTTRLSTVRFFFLNGMDDWDSGDERQWLERALASADAEAGLAWRIAVVHQGPWSAGPHGGNEKLLRAHVPELLAAHKVDLVLSGHDHIYERGDAGALKYVVSGGGGAPLYRVAQTVETTRRAEASYHFVEITTAADALRLVAHRLDGSVIEACGLPKAGPWDCDPFPWKSPRAAAAATPATPAPQPPTAPAAAATSSRCGCELPGGPGSPAAFAALGGVVNLALALLRRLRRG
jgi:hypothetical protein